MGKQKFISHQFFTVELIIINKAWWTNIAQCGYKRCLLANSLCHSQSDLKSPKNNNNEYCLRWWFFGTNRHSNSNRKRNSKNGPAQLSMGWTVMERWRLHASLRISHSLPYDLPSEPHTGDLPRTKPSLSHLYFTHCHTTSHPMIWYMMIWRTQWH